jgi:hypothetical protein
MIRNDAPVRKPGLGLTLAALCLLAGCHGGELCDRSDPLSMERLADLPPAATVLLSLHGDALPADLPALGEGGRRVGGFGGSVLVVAARDAVSGLARLSGVERVVVWGDGARMGRMDAPLRDEILSRLDGERRDEPLPAIATFAGDAPGLVEELTALGARVGSRSGAIVTLEAAPQVLLRVLARADLTKLEKPILMQPSANR